jgi:hypothetical protein
MTLADLVNVVCTKMHRIDAESQAEAKVYLKARYRMMWDSRPWKDALAVMDLGNSGERTIILPGVVDRILAVRWNRLTIESEHLVTVFLTDPQKFDSISNALSYSIIAPSGVEISPGGHQVMMFSDSASAQFTVAIHGIKDNVEKREMISISGANNSTSVNEYDEIFSLSKTSTTYGLTVKNAAYSTTILELKPGETSKSHQRIMLHATPIDARNVFILYKRRCPDLINDSDATQITGFDNALIAAGISDMLESQRHYGKAQMKAQEAGILAQAAADLDTHQQANIIRIIPWEGFDSGESELPGKGYL